MNHFDIAQWTEYVRGLVAPREREAMEKHLAGCQPCAEWVALLSRVRQAGADEVTVPQHLVQSAKAVFPTQRAADDSSCWTLWPSLVAKLIFSNQNDLAPEGARSSMDTLVQVVYHAGDYAIDLQIEPEPESTELALVGQVVYRKGSGVPLEGVPVRLMAGKKLISAAQSNRFGEFCIVSKFQHGLKLCMPIEAVGRRVEIPLDKLMTGFRP